MAFPKFKPDFKHAMLGVGALAIAALPLVSGPSSAEDAREIPTSASSISAMPTFSTDDREIPGFTTTDFRATTIAADTVRTEEARYEGWDLPTPSSATAERPYHYVRFDQATKNQYVSGPTEMTLANSDRLVVLNFIDEQDPRFSDMQKHILDRTLTVLAPESKTKELMLVDVVVRDAQGNTPYMGEFGNYYDRNQLGRGNTHLEDTYVPYGVVVGEAPNGKDLPFLFDFSLISQVQTNADLNANADAISLSFTGLVRGYNQQHASLNVPNAPTLVAVNE